MSNINTRDLIGIPFVDGGRDPRQGLDCWGLVLEIFRRCDIVLPDYRIGCMEASRIDGAIADGRELWTRQDPSDPPVPSLVVIRFNQATLCNHTGVYIGAGRFIHTRRKIGVNIDRIDSPAWRKVIEGYYLPGPQVTNPGRGQL